jgi:hypothetical protein
MAGPRSTVCLGVAEDSWGVERCAGQIFIGTGDKVSLHPELNCLFVFLRVSRCGPCSASFLARLSAELHFQLLLRAATSSPHLTLHTSFRPLSPLFALLASHSLLHCPLLGVLPRLLSTLTLLRSKVGWDADEAERAILTPRHTSCPSPSYSLSHGRF